MAAGNTYVAIATQTLGSAAASVTFSSIPSTYTDLILVFNGSAASNAYCALRFNGDTGNNYSLTAMRGTGSAVDSSRSTNSSEMYLAIGSPNTTTQNNFIAQIMNYANTTTYKTALARTNNSNVEVDASVGLWRNTSAINSITITNAGVNFAVGSVFSIYGIAAA